MLAYRPTCSVGQPPLALGERQILKRRTHRIVPAVEVAKQRHNPHDLDDLAIIQMRAQPRTDLGRYGIWHGGRGLCECKRRFLGIGEMRAYLEIENIGQPFLTSVEAFGGKDHMRLTIKAPRGVA